MSPSWFELLRRLADGLPRERAELRQALDFSPTRLAEAVQGLVERGLPPRVEADRLSLPVELELLVPERLALEREKLAWFAELDSTNQYLLDLPLSDPVSACLAEYQTAGRGRRGRPWLAPPACGLCLSLRRIYSSPPPPGLNLALSLACVQYLESLGIQELGLKWPNDILWRTSHKLAGLLVETRLFADGSRLLVAGLGLNLNLTPSVAEHIGQAWTDLGRITPSPPGRNQLAAGLLAVLGQVMDAWPTRNFAAYQSAWRDRDVLRDQAVRMSAAGETVPGVARGVDPEGRLELETPAGIRRFHDGEAWVIRATELSENRR